MNVVKMFPAVKKLDISGYCGMNVNNTHYQVVLDKLELDSLEIDATDWLTNKRTDIILSVHVIKKNVNRFYKAAYDGLWVKEIQENEFGQSGETKVYNIKAKNLNSLTLYEKQNFSKEDFRTTLSFM